MSQTLRTESDVMREAAKNVDTANDDIHSELLRLRGVADDVSGYWEGAARGSFVSLMQRYDTAATNLEEALASIADNLRSNAVNYEDVEATNSAALDQLAGEGLPL